MKTLIAALGALPLCCLAQSLQVRVLDADGTAISGAAVYLENHANAAVPQSAQSHEVTQRNGQFAPYVSVVRQDQEITFSNSDDITHHVYSFNGPARFSFKIRPGETHQLAAQNSPGIIAMGCNIHDWMSGYLMVVDTPFHAVTGTDGIARFSELPATGYHLVAWHPQMDEAEQLERHVDIPADTSVELRMRLPMAEIPRQEGLDDFDFLEAY